MKTDLTLSRPFHDWLLGYNDNELNTLYKLHKVSWSISGPTFRDVGNWHRLWLQDAHLAYCQLGKDNGIDLLIRYRK